MRFYSQSCLIRSLLLVFLSAVVYGSSSSDGRQVLATTTRTTSPEATIVDRRLLEQHSRGTSASWKVHVETASSSLSKDERRRRQQQQQQRYVRVGRHHRQLPVDGQDWFPDMDGDFSSAEAGFAAGVVLVLIAIVTFIACCCCGCSLCDILACFCLWEICCGGGGADGMDNSFVSF